MMTNIWAKWSWSGFVIKLARINLAEISDSFVEAKQMLLFNPLKIQIADNQQITSTKQPKPQYITVNGVNYDKLQTEN